MWLAADAMRRSVFTTASNPARTSDGSEEAMCIVRLFSFWVSGIADLSAHVSVEGGLVQHDLVVRLPFRSHAAVAGDADVRVGGMVVPHEFRLFDGEHFHPVVGLYGRGVARAVFLRFQFFFETGDIDFHALFRSDQLRQVDRETEGVVQGEGVASADDFTPFGEFPNDAVEQVDPRSERSQERAFFFGDHFFDELLLGFDLGELAAHLFHERRHQAADERFGEAEVGIAVPNGAAQDTADDVARFHVAGQLAVGYGEGDGPQVVGDDAHGDILFRIGSVIDGGHPRDFLQKRLEHVGVVIRFFALDHHTEAFETHPGIDVPGGQRL